jgi:hypothetical protein
MKNLYFYCFVTLKTDVNVTSKSKNQKYLYFVDIMKATDEKSRILILYRIPDSVLYGSVELDMD